MYAYKNSLVVPLCGSLISATWNQWTFDFAVVYLCLVSIQDPATKNVLVDEGLVHSCGPGCLIGS